jgi:hypothetical protein
MTDTQIAALREIVGRMTPGKWETWIDDDGMHAVTCDSGFITCLFPPELGAGPGTEPDNAAGIVALRNTAMPIIDAQAARIAQLEGALRGMVFIYNYGDAAHPGYRVSVMEEARAALEGRAS